MIDKHIGIPPTDARPFAMQELNEKIRFVRMQGSDAAEKHAIGGRARAGDGQGLRIVDRAETLQYHGPHTSPFVRMERAPVLSIVWCRAAESSALAGFAPGSTAAAQNVAPELEALRAAAVRKIRDHLLLQIAALRKEAAKQSSGDTRALQRVQREHRHEEAHRLV